MRFWQNSDEVLAELWFKVKWNGLDSSAATIELDYVFSFAGYDEKIGWEFILNVIRTKKGLAISANILRLKEVA
jgi:hypothetical protein